MRHALDKHRDIARSILPTKNRRVARDELARARRRNRHHVADELRGLSRELSGDPDRWLDHEGDPFATADREVNQVRRARRSADKLSHFERWAVMRTRDVPIADRLSFIRSVLPDGIIGEHAMTHLDHIPALAGRLDRRWSIDWERNRTRRHAEQVDVRGRCRAGLHDAIDHGDHRELNLALRRRTEAAGLVVAPIAGTDDVERILSELGPAELGEHGRAAWGVLRNTLDEVVPDWRRLDPRPDPVDGPWKPAVSGSRRQSWATGLTWMPLIGELDLGPAGEVLDA